MNDDKYKDINYKVEENKKSNKFLKKYSGKETRKKIILVSTILLIVIIGVSFYYLYENTSLLSFIGNKSDILSSNKFDSKINVVYDKTDSSINDVKINKYNGNEYISNFKLDYYREYTLYKAEQSLRFMVVKFKSFSKNKYFKIDDYISFNKDLLLKGDNENIYRYKESLISSRYKIISYLHLSEFNSRKILEYIKYKNKKLYILISTNYDEEYSKKIFNTFVNSN